MSADENFSAQSTYTHKKKIATVPQSEQQVENSE